MATTIVPKRNLYSNVALALVPPNLALHPNKEAASACSRDITEILTRAHLAHSLMKPIPAPFHTGPSLKGVEEEEETRRQVGVLVCPTTMYPSGLFGDSNGLFGEEAV